MKARTFRRFPEWAICYAMYGDSSSLDEEDIALFERWSKANNVKTVVSMDESTRNEFDPFPLFGLASATYDVVCEVM